MYDSSRTKPLTSLPTSTCQGSTCSLCFTKDIQTGKKTYISGDIIIGGAFPIHSALQSSGLQECGELVPENVLLLQAFLYAIEKINSLPSVLFRVKIGSLNVDYCSDNYILRRNVLDFHKGYSKISNSDGGMADPRLVVGYVGAGQSQATETLFQVLKDQIKIPLVSYSATSGNFRDSRKFPNFTNTSPMDDMQAKTISLIAREMGWTHIQAVADDTDEMRSGLESLKEEAWKHGICVVSQLIFGRDGDHKNIINKLTEKKNAKVVVVFASGSVLSQFLKAINTNGAGGKLLLVGTTSWGDSWRFIQNQRNVVTGAITLRHASAVLTDFHDYLDKMDPYEESTFVGNPWFPQYYEAMLECYIDKANNPRGYPTDCIRFRGDSKISKVPNFSGSQYLIGIINAVYTFAYSLQSTLRHYCPDILSDPLCSDYMHATDKYQRLVQNIQSVSFRDVTGKDFSMMDGQGSGSYEILSLVNGASYTKVCLPNLRLE